MAFTSAKAIFCAKVAAGAAINNESASIRFFIRLTFSLGGKERQQPRFDQIAVLKITKKPETFVPVPHVKLISVRFDRLRSEAYG
jgi:hypothetical protein